MMPSQGAAGKAPFRDVGGIHHVTSPPAQGAATRLQAQPHRWHNSRGPHWHPVQEAPSSISLKVGGPGLCFAKSWWPVAHPGPTPREEVALGSLSEKLGALA